MDSGSIIRSYFCCLARQTSNDIKVIETADGSKTLYLPELDETYHSTHGAVTESNYVYIEKGLDFWFSMYPNRKRVSVFEMGLGTGTNALLAMNWCESKGCDLKYYTVEKFPLSSALMREYCDSLSSQSITKTPLDVVGSMPLSMGLATKSDALHSAPWETWVDIGLKSGSFSVYKHESDIQSAVIPQEIDVVFWDAFGPKKQDGVWGVSLFKPLFDSMRSGGVFVTYSASGDVKRALKEVGFKVEKLEGPPHKRHMLRALKV